MSANGRLAAPWTPGGFVALLVLYVLLHLVLRLLVSPTVTIDDSREAVLGQTLEWGYGPRQPPFYNWLVWGAFQLFGVGLASLALVKYGLLFVTYLFVYASARQLMGDTRLRTLAAFSLLLMAPISVTLHESLTHSVAVLAACALTFHALLWVEASGSPWAYVTLGLALALGVLSKFSYGLFAGALLAAALSIDRFRSRLLRPGIWLTLAVAVLLVLPYARWFLSQDFPVTTMYAAEMRSRTGGSYLQGAGAGFYFIVRMAAYYLAPLGLVLLVLAPRVYTARVGVAVSTRAYGRLLGRFFLLELGLLLLAVLVTGLQYLKFRWMIPAFFLFPLYLFWRLDVTGFDDRLVRRLAVILLATELCISAAIVARVYGGDLFSRPHRLNRPYPAIARQIAATGFHKGTIVAGEGSLGGNLRLAFPDSRVISLESPAYIPRPSGGGQCLIAWEDATEAIPADIRRLATSVLGVAPDRARPRVAETPYRFSPTRQFRVHYVLFDRGMGTCR